MKKRSPECDGGKVKRLVIARIVPKLSRRKMARRSSGWPPGARGDDRWFRHAEVEL